jgi:NADH-quinone oxidoreductase subunit A
VSGYLGGYGLIAIVGLIGALLVIGALLTARLVRPHRPSPGKDSTYECGLDPVGEDWAQSQIRYFVFAFLYVIFAVESVFLFPWAVVFAEKQFGVGAVVEMGIFVLFLAIGLVYAWRKKVMTWT